MESLRRMSSSLTVALAALGAVGMLALLFPRHREDTSLRRLNVVVTGSTKGPLPPRPGPDTLAGIGRALAEEHLRLGDNVIVSGRSAERVAKMVGELRRRFPSSTVHGYACDISNSEQCRGLAQYAVDVRTPI